MAAEKVVEPSSNWNIDYGADSCNLRRTFGEGDNALFLELQQVLATPYYNLLVSGEPLRKTPSDIMQVQFGPNEIASKRGFLMGSGKGDKAPFLVMFGVHLAPVAEDTKRDEFAVVDIGPEREKAITQLTLSRGLYDAITFETGPMHEPLQALRTCVADLTEVLGLSDEAQKAVATKAEISNLPQTARFIQARYPKRHFTKAEDGLVTVRLLIDPKGEAKACQVANSTRPADFDDYVCYTMLRVAEYEPAKNAAGEPVYSFLSQAVRFEIH